MEPFKGWAILELMGHRRLAGHVQEVTLAGAGMLRIDVPGKDGADATQFFSPSSVYAMTPCGEATARKVAGSGMPAPVNEWELPSLRGKALPAGRDEAPEGDALDEMLRDYGLGGLLLELQNLHVDAVGPEADRFTAILEHARLLVLTPDAWPEQAGAGAGVEAIAKARDGQLAQGYDAAHDDEVEGKGQLVAAAAWLVYNARTEGVDYSVTNAPRWASQFIDKHRGAPLTLLANAGALIAAEIDRLTRAAHTNAAVDEAVVAHVAGVDAAEAVAATSHGEAPEAR